MVLSCVCIFLQHRDTPENNPDTPFDFTPENYKVCLGDGQEIEFLYKTEIMAHCDACFS